ncbi:MAG: hypothetical protein ABSC61_08330 [Anaerolineales bacterium]
MKRKEHVVFCLSVISISMVITACASINPNNGNPLPTDVIVIIQTVTPTKPVTIDTKEIPTLTLIPTKTSIPTPTELPSVTPTSTPIQSVSPTSAPTRFIEDIGPINFSFIPTEGWIFCTSGLSKYTGLCWSRAHAYVMQIDFEQEPFRGSAYSYTHSVLIPGILQESSALSLEMEYKYIGETNFPTYSGVDAYKLIYRIDYFRGEDSEYLMYYIFYRNGNVILATYDRDEIWGTVHDSGVDLCMRTFQFEL